MRKGLLNDEMQNWLYANFASMTNENLVIQLSEMIKKENEKEIPRLKSLLGSITMPAIRRSVEKEIARRTKFTHISISTVKRAAADLKCPPKSYTHKAAENRRKARQTNIKRWKEKAQQVDDIPSWLRSFRPREVRICIIRSDKELKSIRNAITYFNHSAAEQFGYYFTTEHIKEASLFRVRATPYAA